MVAEHDPPMRFILVCFLVLLADHVVKLEAHIGAFCACSEKKHHILASVHHMIERHQ